MYMYAYIHVFIHIYIYIHVHVRKCGRLSVFRTLYAGALEFSDCLLLFCYGVATISRMLKNIGLFCKRALQKRPIFCKETYIFKHPTHRSHPIAREAIWRLRV